MKQKFSKFKYFTQAFFSGHNSRHNWQRLRTNTLASHLHSRKRREHRPNHLFFNNWNEIIFVSIFFCWIGTFFGSKINFSYLDKCLYHRCCSHRHKFASSSLWCPRWPRWCSRFRCRWWSWRSGGRLASDRLRSTFPSREPRLF
mgnify:CR=1 FL=1